MDGFLSISRHSVVLKSSHTELYFSKRRLSFISATTVAMHGTGINTDTSDTFIIKFEYEHYLVFTMYKDFKNMGRL